MEIEMIDLKKPDAVIPVGSDDDFERIRVHPETKDVLTIQANLANATRVQLADLNDDDLAAIFIHLGNEDIIAIQATGNQRLMRNVQSFNDHMLLKYQVALWLMQRKINFFDKKVFRKIYWPSHILDFYVFTPIFADQANFVRNFIQVYCPLASLFKKSPPPDATKSCSELIGQMYELSKMELNVDKIMTFVDIAFAALEELKKLTDNETSQQTISMRNLQVNVKRVTRKDFPTLVNYMECIDGMRYDELIVHQWNGNPRPIDFVLQALTRIRIFEKVMQHIEAVSMTCVPLRYITDGALDRFQNLVGLQLKIGYPSDFRQLLEYLADENRIRDLCIMGFRSEEPEEAVQASDFLPFSRYTALRRLSFKHCSFLNDVALKAVMSNLINVTTFGSHFNTNITANGMVRALRLQRNITLVELNRCRVRVFHGHALNPAVTKKYLCLVGGMLLVCVILSYVNLYLYWTRMRNI